VVTPARATCPSAVSPARTTQPSVVSPAREGEEGDEFLLRAASRLGKKDVHALGLTGDWI
jgi:hypothetical protein